MPLTINLDTQATADLLVTEYARLAAALATMPVVDGSDQGRSVSNTASRKALIDAMEAIRLQLSRMAGPVFSVSRMKP